MISKIVENAGPVPLCKTEVIKNTLNPMWKVVVLNLQQVGSKVIVQFTLEYASSTFSFFLQFLLIYDYLLAGQPTCLGML